MKAGTLIVFEGIDGAGKQTQVKRLARHLRIQGERVKTFSSPRYDTPTGKLIRHALSGAYGDFVGLSPYLSGTPYLLDFQANNKDILSALEAGVVICDRHIASTVAYHAAKLEDEAAEEYIRFIEDLAHKQLKIPKATLTIYLDVPVKRAKAQMKGRALDQHERNTAYQHRVAETYKRLSQRRGWRVIQCMEEGDMRTPEAIHADIVGVVGKLR